jgi:hypothetical protein
MKKKSRLYVAHADKQNTDFFFIFHVFTRQHRPRNMLENACFRPNKIKNL